MRTLIENNFGIVLLLSCVIGLAVPGLEKLPDSGASMALALLTFTSCFKLRDGGVENIRWRQIGKFYVLRYIALPLMVFFIAEHTTPVYAQGLFLLALVPAAVATPAFAQLFGGIVPPAFALVISSTLLAPLMIPLHFALFADQSVAPSPVPLFRTLAFCVILPIMVYFLAKRQRRLGDFMYQNVRIISVLLVAFVIALVIGKQREVILSDVTSVMLPLAMTFSLNAVFIAIGLWFGRKLPRELQITYATCSGFSNVALGVSLALLHFPPPIILLVAVSEISWALLPLMMGFAIKISHRR